MRGLDRLVVNLIEGGKRMEEFDPFDMERAELEAFADAVAKRVPYPIPKEEALQNVAVLEAILVSSREGRTAML